MEERSMHVAEADPPHGLAVRPDVLCVSIGARVQELAPLKAIALLRDIAATLRTRAAALHPGAELSARRLDLGRPDARKSAKEVSGDVQLDGVLFVPLDPSADFWARAELAARVDEMVRGLIGELARSKSPVRVGHRQPVPRVRDTAKHRVELTTRWRAQLLALTEGVGKPAPPGGWEIPDEVVQQAVSLEEVRLLLVPSRRGGLSREAA